MAAEVNKLPAVRAPEAPAPLTADQRYWQSFSSQQLIPTPNQSPITYISTNSPAVSTSSVTSSSLTASTAYIVATTGPRLQLLSPHTLKVVKTIARTSTPFHGANVRRDGRIVTAGSDSGSIQVFDTSSRAILRTWNEHKQPVWVTQWHPQDLTTIMSASDDTTVRLWDLPSSDSSWTGHGHNDYVRTGAFIGDGNLIATGSYDQSVRIWDTRIGHSSSSSSSSSCVMTFQLPHPVENVLPLASGSTLVASSGPSLAVLDLIAAKPLSLLTNHQKSITSLSLASQGTRLLSGGLDGHVKVFNTADWTVLAGFKYASPILSISVVGAGPEKVDRHLCVGMQSGLLSIRTKLSASARAAAKEKEAEMAALVSGDIEEFDAKKRKRDEKKKRGLGWDKRLRGKDYTGEGADIVINDSSRRSVHLRKQRTWEGALRRAEYPKALDLALATRDSISIFTVLTALVHRSALRTAIQGRSTLTLTPLLLFLKRHVASAKFVRLTTDVISVVLDVYGEHLGKNEELDRLIEALHEEVRKGAEAGQMCLSTVGMMDLLKAGTTV